MAISPFSLAVNQLRNNFLRYGGKQLSEDDERKIYDQTLAQSTMGAQMGGATATTIRGATSFFGKDLKNIGTAAYDFFGRGMKGKIAQMASRYGATAMLIAQTAELPANLILDAHMGRGAKPAAHVGPVTVAATSAILPLGVISLGASAIHPSLGKPATFVNEQALSFLRGWVRSAGKQMPEPERNVNKGDSGPMDWEYAPPQRGPMRFLQQQARKLEGHISDTYKNPEDAMLMKSMLLSNRRHLSSEMLAEFDKTGQSHILAFSGLHASILGMYLYGAYKALTGAGRFIGRVGSDAIQRIQSKTLPVPLPDLIRQHTDAERLENLFRRSGSTQKVKLPFRAPRTMAEYLQNQRYLHSVDPDVTAGGENQIKRVMQQVTRRFGTYQPPPTGAVTPVSFRSPREALSPINAPWDRMFTTGVLQEQPNVQSHLLALRYDRMRERVEPLVKHMLSNMPEGFDASDYDVIVPVPSHRRTRKARGGYSPVEELAKGLSKQLGIPMDSRALRRSPPTGEMPTSRMTRQQRRAELQGSLRVNNAERLQGRRVLLLDDFVRSGSTLEIASRKLRQGGARNVDVLALGRSDRDLGGFAQQRSGMDRMQSFLGISLLSGRNEPRYAYPGTRRQMGAVRQRQLATERRRMIMSQESDLKDLEDVYRQLVNRYGQEEGAKLYRQQATIMQRPVPRVSDLQRRGDRAMDTLVKAQKYYNEADVQNVSVHLGYGGSEPRWVGSGTYVAPGQVLTAEHVVQGFGERHRGRPSSGYVRNLDLGLVEFPITQVLLENMESDVALLETVAHGAQRSTEIGTTAQLQTSPAGIDIVGADLYEPGEGLFDPNVGARRRSYGGYMGPVKENRSVWSGTPYYRLRSRGYERWWLV